MLVARLIRALRDVLGEYSKFRIIEQLNAASELLTQRVHLNDSQYAQRARQYRQLAQTVIDDTKVAKYPDDLRNFLNVSQYSSAIPDYIAKIVLNGFPDNKNVAISSPELKLYIDLAQSFRSELGILFTTVQKLNIEDITIPPNTISFDIIIPRSIFNNIADEFISVLSRFTRIMSYLLELTTGSQNSPALTYTCTSDPVTGLALVGVAAWGFLNFL